GYPNIGISMSAALLDDTRQHQERDRLQALLHLGNGPNEIGLDRGGREHAMRNTAKGEELEQDLAHQDVLRNVLALVAAPRDEEENRQPIHQKQRGERVETGAEPRVLHKDRQTTPGEPRADGQSDRDVLADGRHVWHTWMCLER